MTTDTLLQHLTLADLELIEEISGVSIRALDDPSTPMAGLLTALAFIISRKQETPKSIDELRAMNIGEVEEIIESFTPSPKA